MESLRFLDFDLMFQRTAEGYRASVLGSPAGQASVELAPPFSDLEIENFLLRFGRARQSVRRLGTPQIEFAQAFGGRLFEAAFNGEVRSCLRSSLDEAQRLDLGLRIRLRLAEAPELNDLPWEFLLHPGLNRFLALSAETPLVRYLDLPERIRPLAVKPPLKVLTVISSPVDFAPLDVESEWRKLQESLAELQARGLVVLSRLESPTLSHLQRWLRREDCHILHFIGHGGFNRKTDDGLLLFSDEKGRGREVTGQALGTLLHDHRPLRLAVLNACEGARASRSDPFAGVAQNLVRQGIPAVVAMQFEFSDSAAISFAYELYAAVVDGYPIDAALAEARKALYFAGHELEWGTPVLYMRSPDGRLFDIGTAEVIAETRVASVEPKPAAQKPQPDAPKPATPAVSKPIPAPIAPRPVEVKAAGATSTGKSLSHASSRRGGLPVYVGLAALLGLAVFIGVRLFLGNGQPETKPQEVKTSLAEPSGAEITTLAQETPALAPERPAGLYLTTPVHKGEKITESMVEVVGGESRGQKEPQSIQEVLRNCFETDLEAGHKVAWSDLREIARARNRKNHVCRDPRPRP